MLVLLPYVVSLRFFLDLSAQNEPRLIRIIVSNIGQYKDVPTGMKQLGFVCLPMKGDIKNPEVRLPGVQIHNLLNIRKRVN